MKNPGKKSNVSAQQEMRKILELAVSCRFLSVDQEKKILHEIMDLPEKNPDKFTAQFLFKEKILPKDKIELLFAVKKHLDVLMQDKMFGKLGVANQFVSQEKVDQALNLQIEIFRKNKKSIKIGDILENIKEISSADKTAILLTQDRIRDELLAEALNTIAITEIEKIDSSRRFGAIAIKMELITPKQLNSALKTQEKEVKEKGAKRYLGELLKDLYGITDKNILKILKSQKILETKRLNLKKKLDQYQSERQIKEVLKGLFEFHLSADNLSVRVKTVKESSKTVKVSELMALLSLAGIKFGFCDEEKIEAYLKKNKPGDELRIANGLPPVNHRQESAEYFFDVDGSFKEMEDSEKKSVVKKGDILARVVPYEEGTPGKNVFGHSIPVPDIPALFLNCGEGVIRKGNDFIADREGNPVLYSNRTLFVMPADQVVTTREINTDIIENTDESCVSCILKVKGNIARGVTVSCHGLHIEGNILGNVMVKGDITVKGNIGKAQKSNEVLSDPVFISAKGVVEVSRNIINAKVFAARGVHAPNSDVVSSEVSSFQTIIVKNVLTANEKPSVLKIGRENFFKIDSINEAVNEKMQVLNRLLFKEEREQLTRELMKQIRIRDGYLEKQNAILYLKKILDNPELKSIKDISEKIKTALENEQNILVPEGKKVRDFIEKIIRNINGIDENAQDKYIQDLLENISGVYQAAVKETERIEKQHEVRSKAMEADLEKNRTEIEGLKKQIEKLKSQRDILLTSQEKSEATGEPAIKVKNRVDADTLIKGEKAELKIESAIHGVFIKEDGKTARGGSKIIIEGYFE